VQEAEQKVMGKKVQMISNLDKAPVNLSHKAKYEILRNIMGKMEDIGGQIDKLQKDFESSQKQ